ncbi:unnamed protein product [Symbiodinium pilosum]|uniref:C3H1-type domain-containing protein n=1 Tax=Symbiodinium pilosum TaxID=2952 RepID=A0A812XHE5_SYMPI|nr:unnamed protein product [Symbiodinium pilosum]
MPELGAEAPVAFADWLYEFEQAVGSLSDRASTWFGACLEVARTTYTEYMMASPVNRLSLQPQIPRELKEEKWARLDRKVMTLLLSSMRKPAKEDAITHRIVDVPSLLFRLHVLYQPGGASERASILKHLEGKACGENVHECIAALRKWRRYLERAESMQVSVPDASVLLVALELMLKKVLEVHPEVKFRVALMKNELQLQGRPTVSGVLRLYTHALAELQMVAPVQVTSSGTALKAIEGATAGTGESASPTRATARKGTDTAASKVPCKFFASKTGCSKGANCKFGHTFDNKDDKKQRCWECGSTLHHRSECPTRKPKSPKKGNEPTDAQTTLLSLPAPPSLQQQAILESTQAAQASASSATTSAVQPPVPLQLQPSPSESTENKDAEVRALLKEANAMLSKLTKLQTLEVQTNQSIGELSAAIRAAGLEDEQGFALLDSGASHAFKTADREVVERAAPVRVELAGGQYVTLKQNRAGTLLAAADDPEAACATPILPLGALVQKLGCELTWTRKGGLKVIHPQFGVLRTFVKGNHPMLAETQALELISQLEEEHLQSLEEAMAETSVRALDYEEMRSWDFLLGKFVATGGRDCLLTAMSSSGSPLGVLPQSVLSLAAVQVGLDDKQGWKYLKALPLNRSARKAMMARRWVVRLYRREGEADLQVSNSEGVVTIDCNVARSKRFSMKGDSPMYKALMLAAARGQVEGVLGCPPVNDGQELLAKQLLLWAVARQGAAMHGLLPPYLLLGSPPASSMWKSDMWQSFRQEYHVPMMQIESHEDGANYLIATNLAMKGDLLAPDSVEVSEKLSSRAWPNIWKLPFQQDLGLAVDRWRVKPDEMFLGYMLHKLDSETPWTEKEFRYWRRHVANGHLPFDRRCRTCIQTAATGRAHRRVIAPSCYALSVDVCGPSRRSGELAGRKGYRYALIATYIMPKISGFKDVPVPEGEGLEQEDPPPAEDDFLEERSPPEPPLESKDQEELEQSNQRFQELYKDVGDTMEYQTLHYAIPLRSRLMPEVEDAIKQVYLQLRSEGLPVTRVHSDRARELRGAKLRTWLLHRDVLPTTGEAQTPQTNGRAEAGVRRAKTRTKTLLRAAGLDTCCWPYAMVFAAFQQRECALGRDKHVIPFGSPVMVKNKVYGTGGHFDLEDRWQGGVYVGPSQELRQGHIVRFPSGRIVTSLHLRANVEDPDSEVPLPPVEAAFPVPARRVTGKRSLEVHESRTSDNPPEPPEVPLDHGVPPGHDAGHLEAAGVWTDEEHMVGFLGTSVPRLMMCEPFSNHPEPPEVPVDHGDTPGALSSNSLLAVRALKALSEPERRAEELAESYLKAGIMGTTLVVQLFETLEEVQQLFTRASRRKPRGKATSWATGAFTHGGVSGLRDGARRLPNVTKFLAKFARELMKAEQFAAITIQRNGGGPAHRDFHNYPGSKNWLCPLTSFEGGGLWTQLGDEEALKDGVDVVMKEVKPGLEIKGKILEARRGKAFSFDPMKWHEVQNHIGERIMVIAYTPRLSNFDIAELEYLKGLGFRPFGEEEGEAGQGGSDADRPPSFQGPEGGSDADRPPSFQVPERGSDADRPPSFQDAAKAAMNHESPLLVLNEAQAQLLEDLQERSQALRLLLEEEYMLAEDLRQAGKLVEEETEKVQLSITHMLRQASERLSKQDRAVLRVCLKAASEASEPDYEKLLESLENDLQVKPVVSRWNAAIRKELDNLFQGGTLIEISRDEARRLERQGVLRLVPSKGVHTLKPPVGKNERYKRKYRLVLCGNFAAPEEQFGSLYAGGASAETFRTVLAIAAGRGWQGATADITGAFLLAPWPEHLHRYAVVPPRLLVDNGYVAENAYWLVCRPLYGLRESPAIWASYRSTRFSQARIPYMDKYLVLRASKVDSELWFIFFEGEDVLLVV